MAKTVKPVMSIDDQIGLLRSRGMTVDEALAHQWLSNVSYYRLSAYWYPARLRASDGGRIDTFTDGTTFTDVVRLYEADRKLRTLVHDGMERVEVALRTHVGEQLRARGPDSYTDPSAFRPAFDHAAWMTTAGKRVRRAARHGNRPP